MKHRHVRCINDYQLTEEWTIGKIYKLISIDRKDRYIVYDDEGERRKRPPTQFELIPCSNSEEDYEL